jgi:hypothetical protein
LLRNLSKAAFFELLRDEDDDEYMVYKQLIDWFDVTIYFHASLCDDRCCCQGNPWSGFAPFFGQCCGAIDATKLASLDVNFAPKGELAC